MSKAHRGRKVSPETRAKMRQAQQERRKREGGLPRPDMRGKKNVMHRPEVKAKHPMLQKGQPKPPEQRAKIAASLRGRTYPVGWGRSKRPGYAAAHRRLDREYGPIKTQNCAVCGDAATHWVLLHEARTRRDKRHRRYSLDPTDYIAMCAICHSQYDHGTLRFLG